MQILNSMTFHNRVNPLSARRLDICHKIKGNSIEVYGIPRVVLSGHRKVENSALNKPHKGFTLDRTSFRNNLVTEVSTVACCSKLSTV